MVCFVINYFDLNRKKIVIVYNFNELHSFFIHRYILALIKWKSHLFLPKKKQQSAAWKFFFSGNEPDGISIALLGNNLSSVRMGDTKRYWPDIRYQTIVLVWYKKEPGEPGTPYLIKVFFFKLQSIAYQFPKIAQENFLIVHPSSKSYCQNKFACSRCKFGPLLTRIDIFMVSFDCK